MSLRVLWTLLTAASAVAAQFISPPTDLQKRAGSAGVNVRYKQVPNGICETNSSVKSISGYADIAPDQHIFFWFFEARNVDPTTAPLTVWIQGGPGSSSMIALFSELGPCSIDYQGQVQNNPYSWSTNSNLLFIDQPVTSGFSYTTPVHAYINPNDYSVHRINGSGCPAGQAGNCGTFSDPNPKTVPNSTATAAPAFWKSLQGFIGAFPQYSSHGIHFGSESYGGHWAPVFNEYIEKQNANLPDGAQKINLKSVLVGNGWFSPMIQYQAYYNFTVNPGNTYDYRPFNATIEKRMYNNLYGSGNCLDGLANCQASGNNTICSKADDYCTNHVQYLFDDITNRDENDIRELSPDPFPYHFYSAYLNRIDVLQAIGAYTNYSDHSALVNNAFGRTGDDGRLDSTIADVQALVSQGVYFVSYCGDADYKYSWIGNGAVADAVNAPGYTSAGFSNISTSDHIVHGQVRQANNYAFLRIYYSGHEVPFYQPLLALTMLDRVIAGRDVATGTQNISPSLISSGPPQSLFREGNGTIQYKVVPPQATYNTTTGEPNPPY